MLSFDTFEIDSMSIKGPYGTACFECIIDEVAYCKDAGIHKV